MMQAAGHQRIGSIGCRQGFSSEVGDPGWSSVALSINMQGKLPCTAVMRQGPHIPLLQPVWHAGQKRLIAIAVFVCQWQTLMVRST